MRFVARDARKNMPAFAGMSKGRESFFVGYGVTSTTPFIRPEWPGKEQKKV